MATDACGVDVSMPRTSTLRLARRRPQAHRLTELAHAFAPSSRRQEANGSRVVVVGGPRELELEEVVAGDRRRFLAPLDGGHGGRRDQLLKAEVDDLVRTAAAEEVDVDEREASA